MRQWVSVAAVLLLGAVVLSACVIRRGPTTGVNDSVAAPPVAPVAAKPEMKILKVSGAGGGQTTLFAVKLQWTGDQPQPWTIKRWTMMRDLTDQTQSMIVVEDQVFTIAPGEPHTVQVKALPINPEKEPARNLVIDYPGMPVYQLTEQIVDPRVQAIDDALQRLDRAFADMLPLVKFRGSSIEYLPKDRAKIDPYLELATWDLSGMQPRPYLEQETIEAALVVAFAGGMSVKDYASYLQKKIAGLAAGAALKEAQRLQPKVNKFLGFAKLDVRLKK